MIRARNRVYRPGSTPSGRIEAFSFFDTVAVDAAHGSVTLEKEFLNQRLTQTYTLTGRGVSSAAEHGRDRGAGAGRADQQRLLHPGAAQRPAGRAAGLRLAAQPAPPRGSRVRRSLLSLAGGGGRLRGVLRRADPRPRPDAAPSRRHPLRARPAHHRDRGRGAAPQLRLMSVDGGRSRLHRASPRHDLRDTRTADPLRIRPAVRRGDRAPQGTGHRGRVPVAALRPPLPPGSAPAGASVRRVRPQVHLRVRDAGGARGGDHRRRALRGAQQRRPARRQFPRLGERPARRLRHQPLRPEVGTRRPGGRRGRHHQPVQPLAAQSGCVPLHLQLRARPLRRQVVYWTGPRCGSPSPATTARRWASPPGGRCCITSC